MKYMNCRVRVHTRCGDCYEGVIVNVDNNNVYLKTSGGVRTSAGLDLDPEVIF
jgi:small nuclear ribonucleoprotein (snRNP)-like protein